METAIQVVWSIGLLGALVATGIILKQVMLILRALRDIHQLAGFIREAAQGLRANMSAAAQLSSLDEPGRHMRAATHNLAAAARTLKEAVEALPLRSRVRGG